MAGAAAKKRLRQKPLTDRRRLSDGTAARKVNRARGESMDFGGSIDP